jgi:hypothetical protein
MAEFSWDGFADLDRKLGTLARPDAEAIRPLMESWERAIDQDNRRGVLAGTDKDDRELTPVKKRTGRYKGATGPPLAPFGAASRVIANLVTGHFQASETQWVAVGAWESVVSDAGVHFLPFHFRGEGHLPTRALDGIRAQGLAEAQEALDNWIQFVLPG